MGRILAAAVCVLYCVAPSSASGDPNGVDVYAVPTGPIVEGNIDALVTMVVVCQAGGPYCRRFENTIAAMKRKYRGDLRVARLSYLVGPSYKLPTLAACAAGMQQKYSEMVAAIDRTIRANNNNRLSDDVLRKIAEQELGLDMTRFYQDWNGSCPVDLATTRKIMDKLTVRGTPSTFINGRFIRGAMPPATIDALIAEELEKAKKTVRRTGTARYYYTKQVMKNGIREVVALQAEAGPKPDMPLTAAQADGTRYPAPIAGYPFEGPKDAKVTLVEVCQIWGPFCNRTRDIQRQLRQRYPDDLKIVHVPVFVQPRLKDAALASCVAHKQGRYAQLALVLWDRFGDFTSNQDAADPKALAASAGVNVRSWDRKSAACSKWLEKNWVAYRPLGARGTPTAFVNGRRINGAQPLENFTKLIDEELALANQSIRNRRQLRDYYKKTVLSQPVPAP